MDRIRKAVETGCSTIILGDNLEVLSMLPAGCAGLVYIDPPFNTGATQTARRIRTHRDPEGDRTGFGGRRYRTEHLGSVSFEDTFTDYLEFLGPRLREAHRILAPHGSLFVHLDNREVHYCKVFLDQIFGRTNFMNEIIWSYDYGGRSKNKWSSKHDNILWYAKDATSYVYNYDDIDRIPYLAPSLVGPEKAARGKTPTDVWWQTIVPTNGSERTGYPTQKPLKILDRIVRVHSRPKDLVVDFFAGSGTAGEAAARHGRRFVLVDSQRAAINTMKKRLATYAPSVIEVTRQEVVAQRA
jgi:site-specific DNA-methyltransferase (adenine-specific)